MIRYKAIPVPALALAAMIVAGSAQAQSPLPGPELGIKAGVNLSDIDTSDLRSSTRSGFVGGVYMDLPAFLLHLQVEGLISQQGFKEGAPLAGYQGPNDLEYRTTFVQIPVLLVFALPIPVVSPRAFAGPAFNIPIKSEVKLDHDWTDIKADTKNTWSLILGVGVKAMGLGLDLRYDIGMTAQNDRPLGDILDDAFDEVSGSNNTQDLKGRTFSLTVSLALN
jgi:hypothetical protein